MRRHIERRMGGLHTFGREELAGELRHFAGVALLYGNVVAALEAHVDG